MLFILAQQLEIHLFAKWIFRNREGMGQVLSMELGLNILHLQKVEDWEILKKGRNYFPEN